jgi:TolA-binding protein
VIEFDGSGAARDPKDPRRSLQTVRLEPQAPAKGRRLRRNPVDRAPRLPTATDLKEPEEGELRRLEESEPRASRRSEDPGRNAAQADQAFARAVQKLNDGDRAGAGRDLLSFAARYPQHAAADNAIELAGLAKAQDGDCAAALALFDRVVAEYPAGDAVPAARLEAGRCLLRLGRADEAKATLAAVEKDYPDVPEASQARAVLNGL